MLSFARVQVLLDVARSSLRLLTVELEGEDSVDVEVQYENIPYSECFSAGHLSTKCPFRMKPRLLKTPAQAAVLIAPTTSGDSGIVKGANLQDSPVHVTNLTPLTNPGVTGSVSFL
ncbi:hypothetical protein MRB53_018631 [Persea americana]|uniref:Uncharacterized protein n=1 Tax=Persea americana TaxID=3435 RepID=A0ACC2M808_PERAE|nr:hypothetical protein MRB53_018631 [Persea americana]